MPDVDLDTALRHDNLIVWLELEALRLGTDNQRERWAAKALPNDEIALLARVALFSPLEHFVRWQPIGLRQVPHKAPRGLAMALNPRPWDGVCPTKLEGGPSLDESIEFDTRPEAELSHSEWEIAKDIIDACGLASRHEWCRRQGVAFKIELRTHVGRCKACERSIKKPSILVSVQWAGRTLSREYAL